MAVLGRRAGWVLGVSVLLACGGRNLDMGDYDRTCTVGGVTFPYGQWISQPCLCYCDSGKAVCGGRCAPGASGGSGGMGGAAGTLVSGGNGGYGAVYSYGGSYAYGGYAGAGTAGSYAYGGYAGAGTAGSYAYGGYAGAGAGAAGSYAFGGYAGSGYAGSYSYGGMGAIGGTAGTAGTTCGYARAIGMQPLIDDMQDGDSSIAFLEGRQGTWYSYNDGSGTQYPAAGTLPMSQLLSHWTAYTQGSGFYNWGAGIGFVLDNGCPYDASVYHGISITIVNGGYVLLPISVQVATRATTPISQGGICDEASETCYDNYQSPLALSSGYQFVDVPFSSLYQQGFGKPVVFDATALMGVNFQVAANQDFAFYIENVSFY